MSEYSNGLCTCYEDLGTCAMSYCCPCYVAGKNAEAIGDNCILYGCAALTPCAIITLALTRGKIREKYGIAGSCFSDVLMYWCCPCCALVQDSREIAAHGGAAPAGMAMARE